MKAPTWTRRRTIRTALPVLVQAVHDSGSPAGQVAKDCPVVPVHQVVELLRLATLNRVAYDGQNLVLDYSSPRRKR